MEYSGIKKHFESAKEYAESKLGYPSDSKWKLLDRSCRNQVVYSLITDGQDVMITIDKVKRINGHWMHESFTESDHPHLYDCPKRYIKRSTMMDETAIRWKAECLKKQHLKAMLKNYMDGLQAGDVVKTTNGEYVFLYSIKSAQFIGRSVESEKLYRCNNSSIILGK